MKCEICHKGPDTGTSIYRTTPKGQEPHWRCEKHLEPNKHPAPDKITVEIVKIFEKTK